MSEAKIFTVDDAIEYILDFLSTPRSHSFGSFGYDFRLDVVIHFYVLEHRGGAPHYDSNSRTIQELSPIFFDAAWVLCRRGILRPTVAKYGGQGLDNGTGYSLTLAGKEWLNKRSVEIYIPTEPSRFGAFIKQYRERFGDGFYQRALEALTCHSFGAYLACCAMLGAATESIFLRVAIAKANGDEERVLNEYRRAGGRNLLERQITSSLKKLLAETFVDLTSLIKYWRDEASHGEVSELSETEAYVAIAKLLRFAHFADENWDNLTHSAES